MRLNLLLQGFGPWDRRGGKLCRRSRSGGGLGGSLGGFLEREREWDDSAVAEVVDQLQRRKARGAVRNPAAGAAALADRQAPLQVQGEAKGFLPFPPHPRHRQAT